MYLKFKMNWCNMHYDIYIYIGYQFGAFLFNY